MPLFYQNSTDCCEIAIWNIEEPEDWFLEKLRLDELEQAQLAVIKGHRRLEWLSARYLLSQMLGGVSGAMVKDENGKPHLEHLPLHISLSHSHGLAAVIVSDRLTGIDIQKLVAKIERIAHRVLRPVELDSLQNERRIEHLHVYWGAKEALYKAYGRRELDFCKHILVEPFPFDLENGKSKGQVIKDDFAADFDLHYQQIEDFILVYALQNLDY